MKKESISNPFKSIFMLWYISEIIFNTTLTEIAGIPISQINNFTNYLVLGLMLMQIVFFQKYEMKELLLIGIITIPIVISAVLSSYFTVLSAWLFIVAAKKTDFDDLIRIAYKVLRIMVPMIIILCLLGVIENKIVYRSGVLRYSLGFSHPNQLGLRLFQLLACRFLIRREEKVNGYIFALLLILFTYYVPNSQTAFICMAVLCLFFWMYRLINKYIMTFLDFFQKCLLVVAVLCNGLSVVWSVMGVSGNKLLEMIDTWMSIRFSACHRVLQIFGASLWGQRVYISQEERALVGIHSSLYLDNAYMALIVRYGIVVYLIFTFGYLMTMWYCKKKNQTEIMIIFAVYAVYGVMENGLFNMSHNIFLVIVAGLLYRTPIAVNLRTDYKKKILLVWKGTQK